MMRFGSPRRRGWSLALAHPSGQRTRGFRSFSLRRPKVAARPYRSAAFRMFGAVAIAPAVTALIATLVMTWVMGCGAANAEGPRISHFTWTTGWRSRQVEILPDGLLCTALRHLRQDPIPGPDPTPDAAAVLP
jgi:hypothetical protein